MPSLGSLSFWWRWIAANSLGELLGLGGVAALGYLVVSVTGEPEGMVHVFGMALLFVLAGSFEGLVLGYAQATVLVSQIPKLQGWIKATIVGAVVAWAIGMTPSTIMNLIEPASSAPTPVVSGGLRLLMAAGLGLVAGPILAFFQWRVLRNYLSKAIWWLPANALAWGVGMPIVFAGVHFVVGSRHTTVGVLIAGATLAAAGAVVGAIHGAFLVRMCRRGDNAVVPYAGFKT